MKTIITSNICHFITKNNQTGKAGKANTTNMASNTAHTINTVHTALPARTIFLKPILCLAAAAILAMFITAHPASAKQIKLTPNYGFWTDVQAALNEAQSHPSNSYVVKVPKGTYSIDKCLTVYSNTTLDLRGVTYKKVNVDR